MSGRAGVCVAELQPRARIVKQDAYQVFEITGTNPLLELAIELEKIAFEDEYLGSRQLYPNVTFLLRDGLRRSGCR